MSMGFAAGYAEVFPTEKLKELCLHEYNAFVQASIIDAEGELLPEDERDDDEDYLGEQADYLQYKGGERDVSEEVREAWETLCRKFNERTGLTLHIGVHDSEDNGSQYDELNGVYFCVDGMYQLSPAGELWKAFVKRKHFVENC